MRQSLNAVRREKTRTSERKISSRCRGDKEFIKGLAKGEIKENFDQDVLWDFLMRWGEENNIFIRLDEVICELFGDDLAENTEKFRELGRDKQILAILMQCIPASQSVINWSGEYVREKATAYDMYKIFREKGMVLSDPEIEKVFDGTHEDYASKE